MISAFILDKAQIETVQLHLKNCEELGAEAAVVLCSDDRDEVEKLNRFWEEYMQGDPPEDLPAPGFVYLGPVWVIGTGRFPVEIAEVFRRDEDSQAEGLPKTEE